MDGKLERLRERLLICAVCMDEYKNPRILPCFHSLCFDCIENVIQSSSVTGRFFRCPQCRKDVCIPSGGIQDLPINFYILSLQDELSTRDYEGNCDLCEGSRLPSDFHCIDCDKDMCKFCIHSHRLDNHGEKPNILRIQRNPASYNSASSNLLCTAHDKEKLQLFCFTCNIPVCVVCSCEDHRKHRLRPLSEKLHELRAALKREMVQIDLDVKNLMDTNQLMEDTKTELLELSNKSILALDKAATRACDRIIQKTSALENEILKTERKQLNDIDMVQKKIKTLLRSMHQGSNYIGDLQESDMCLEAFQSFKEFAVKLKKIREEFSTIDITIQRNHFLESERCKTPELPIGHLRNIFFYGNLGSLQSSYLKFHIDPKTLLAKSKMQTSKFTKVYVPCKALFRNVLIFCCAFVIFSLMFWAFDETNVFPLLCSFINEAIEVESLYSTFQKRLDTITYFFQNLWFEFRNTTSMYLEYQFQDI